MGPDEFFHLLKQGAAQQSGGARSHIVGHISSYDPAKHRIRVIVPTYTDDGINFVESGWIKWPGMSVGPGYGVQFAPMGGATINEPMKGEGVLIQRLDNRLGNAAVVGLLFNDVDTAPGGTTLQPGEIIIKAQSGSVLKGTKNGDWTFDLVGDSGKLVVNAKGDVDVTTLGDANVTASGQATIVAPSVKVGAALADTLRGLCTTLFKAWADGHRHSGIQTGIGVSGPPNTTATEPGSTTTVLVAE